MKQAIKMKAPNGLEVEWSEDEGFQINGPSQSTADMLVAMLNDDLGVALYLSHMHRVDVVEAIVAKLLPGAEVVSKEGADKPMPTLEGEALA
jgi:hypothetical protein